VSNDNWKRKERYENQDEAMLRENFEWGEV
jgi:hypothetical protein